MARCRQLSSLSRLSWPDKDEARDNRLCTVNGLVQASYSFYDMELRKFEGSALCRKVGAIQCVTELPLKNILAPCHTLGVSTWNPGSSKALLTFRLIYEGCKLLARWRQKERLNPPSKFASCHCFLFLSLFIFK